MTWFGDLGVEDTPAGLRTAELLLICWMPHCGAHSCDIVSSLLVAPQVCLQSLPSLLPALAGTVAHRSTRLIWERESSRARGKERERERKPRITKTTEEADLTNPRAYKERNAKIKQIFCPSSIFARRTFETREQRAVTITLWFRWGCRGAGRIADEVVPVQWESVHDLYLI